MVIIITECSEHQFSCAGSGPATNEKIKCISSSKKCDGKQDCTSGKDEEECFRLQSFDKNVWVANKM
jgi:hypothetical protein